MCYDVVSRQAAHTLRSSALSPSRKGCIVDILSALSCDNAMALCHCRSTSRSPAAAPCPLPFSFCSSTGYWADYWARCPWWPLAHWPMAGLPRVNWLQVNWWTAPLEPAHWPAPSARRLQGQPQEELEAAAPRWWRAYPDRSRFAPAPNRTGRRGSQSQQAKQWSASKTPYFSLLETGFSNHAGQIVGRTN